MERESADSPGGPDSSEKNILWVSSVKAYSRTEYSPECPLSRHFAKLLGQKNLTMGNIELIKKLGYEVHLKGGKL